MRKKILQKKWKPETVRTEIFLTEPSAAGIKSPKRRKEITLAMHNMNASISRIMEDSL